LCALIALSGFFMPIVMNIESYEQPATVSETV
jgi:hypothetical protein